MGLPNLVLYNSADTTIVTSWAVGIVQAGQSSAELILWLWNNKSGTLADTALNVAVNVRDSNGAYIEQTVAEKWVQAKSNGINNPDSVAGFTDDLQTSFQAIGAGSPLKIGHIPNNCARKLFFKVVVPAGAGTQTGLEYSVRVTRDDNVKALPYFFQRAFGDGVVNETLKTIFPALVNTKVGAWTGAAGSSGAYTGTVAKKYYVKVSTAGALGTAKYKCSDDGTTYSTTEITTSASAATNVTDDADVDLGVDIDLQGITGNLAVGDIWTIEVDVVPFAVKAGTGLNGYVGNGNALISNNHVWQNNITTMSSLAASDETFIFLGVDGAFTTSLSSTAQNDKILIGSITTDATTVTAVAISYTLTALTQDVAKSRYQSVNVPLPDPGGAGVGITNYITWKAPVACVVTKISLIPLAAYVAAASPNDAVIDANKNNGTTAIASLTVVTALAQGSFNEMGTLDAAEKILDAGDDITFDLTANGTADIPAQAVQIDYEITT